MSVVGPLLAFGSALAYAGFDATRKQAGLHLHPLSLTAWLQVVSLPFYGAWAAVVGWHLEATWWGAGVVSILLQASANALFLWALVLAPLSRTVPFLALTPVLSGLAAWALLGETPTPRALAGMALVTLGAFALAVVRGHDGVRVERGSVLVVIVAALWSAGGAV
ncbi:MAG: DMT family transporter, partial [Myxococcota bacterium]